MDIDSGYTAWLLICAALVMLMTPGLAFFYGGLSRAKSVINMMLMSFTAIALVSLTWILVGWSLTYTDGGAANPFVGGFSEVGLRGITMAIDEEVGIPVMVDVGFQMMFAVITVALISGAIADRAKIGAWMVFVPVWAILVYFPVAHWVWGGGWVEDIEIGGANVIDFAGGTAVHINAGAAALALALVLGRRKGFGPGLGRPHNLPFVLLGAALLWFGWFGFNAGSAYAADEVAGLALVNTQVAVAGAALAWLLVERLRYGKVSAFGFASGIIAGLVGITPAASTVTPVGAAIVGVLAGGVCAYAISWKYKLGYDDALDVVGLHMVAGIVGCLAIGFISSAAAGEGVDGLLFGGGAGLLAAQAVSVVGVLAYSFAVTFVIGKTIDAVIGFRLPEEVETNGVDVELHAENAYILEDSLTDELSSPTPPGEEVPSPPRG
ncbi:ammonium transporter [Spiractinospora alimapuensis]|uniref:ammonium transporter n=1 Tax=Spiractinospora alimapuensis TaxID=2820884 RepID=UPI001F4786F8|nr:ammonium transporter [Spiractinospora alimapuensis]QVQ51671.1 ammonium transporter [Spiractinospora alimapuensis]